LELLVLCSMHQHKWKWGHMGIQHKTNSVRCKTELANMKDGTVLNSINYYSYDDTYILDFNAKWIYCWMKVVQQGLWLLNWSFNNVWMKCKQELIGTLLNGLMHRICNGNFTRGMTQCHHPLFIIALSKQQPILFVFCWFKKNTGPKSRIIRDLTQMIMKSIQG
jgi:hypothetical protein